MPGIWYSTGILDGQDLDVGLVQSLERRIQASSSCRIPSAPVTSRMPCGSHQHVEKALKRVVLEAQRLKSSATPPLV
jgi:hypothetical protein